MGKKYCIWIGVGSLLLFLLVFMLYKGETSKTQLTGKSFSINTSSLGLDKKEPSLFSQKGKPQKKKLTSVNSVSSNTKGYAQNKFSPPQADPQNNAQANTIMERMTDIKTAKPKILICNIQNWREAEADLDDVYAGHGQVSEIRKKFIQKYVHDSAIADTRKDWKSRQLIRKLCNTCLQKGCLELEELYQKNENEITNNECLLAIMELSNKSGNYQKAIEAGKKLLSKNTLDSKYEERIYQYMVDSFAYMGDRKKSAIYLEYQIAFQNNKLLQIASKGKNTTTEEMDFLPTSKENQRYRIQRYKEAQTLADMAQETPNPITKKLLTPNIKESLKMAADTLIPPENGFDLPSNQSQKN